MARPAATLNVADLQRLTLDDLRRLAKEHKLIGFSRLRKADLVESLRRHLEKQVQAKAAQARAPQVVPAMDSAPAPASGTAAAAASAAAAPAAAPARAEDPGAMRDPAWNPPELPAAYAKDRLTLMVRDPHWLFSYWEVTPALLARARAEFTGHSWQVLRIHLLDDQERVIDGWDEGIPEGTVSWYLHTGRPGGRFRAELGLTDATGRYRLLVASNTVRAPMDTPSGRWDEEWVGLSRETWERLERAARPFPGSLVGKDMLKHELHVLAAARGGGSDQAPRPAGKKARKP